MTDTPKLADVDLSAHLSGKDEYKERLKRAQLQLLFVQRFLYEKKRRVILVFEGWDAAGKGGTIRRVVENLDPRGYDVHSIGAPTDMELLRHYLHRFWVRLPKPGNFGIFDRSWYGRLLVERVEKLIDKAVWKRAYREINQFEQLLIDDGVPILKFFLHISDEEQLRRFEARQADPFRSWKLTDDDWRNRKKRMEYEKAYDACFKHTHTKQVPWTLISSERKWFGRVHALEAAVAQLAEFFDLDVKLPEGFRKLRD